MMSGWSSQSLVFSEAPNSSLSSQLAINVNGQSSFATPSGRGGGNNDTSRQPYIDDNFLTSFAYINQELELLGLSCIPLPSTPVSIGKLDTSVLMDRLRQVLDICHRTQAVKEELDLRNHRLSCDLEHQKSCYKRLKRSKEKAEREAGENQEKLRQLNTKYKTMSHQIKADEDELRKLTAGQSSKAVQYRHEQRKTEKEVSRLKDRLHQLIADKTPDRKVGMDLMSLVAGGDGKRATWKSGPAKQEEDLYQAVISNYEVSRQELTQENAELRDCLLSLQRELSTLLKRTGDVHASTSHDMEKSNSSLEENEDKTSVGSSRPSITDLDDGYFQLPCDLMRAHIQKVFRETCEQIGQSMSKSLERNMDQVTSPTKRISQSSVCRENPDKIPPDKANGEGSAEISRLKKQIDKYKSIIQQQEELIQQTLSSHSQSVESHFLHESQLLKEKDILSEQRKLFADEKANFDKERKMFTDAAIRLAKEKRSFDAERAVMLKQQFLNITPLKANNSKKDGQSNRLLPATPVFSPAKQQNSTPVSSVIKLQHSTPAFSSTLVKNSTPSFCPPQPQHSTPANQIAKPPQLPSTDELYTAIGIHDGSGRDSDHQNQSSMSGKSHNSELQDKPATSSEERLKVIKASLIQKHLERSRSLNDDGH